MTAPTTFCPVEAGTTPILPMEMFLSRAPTNLAPAGETRPSSPAQPPAISFVDSLRATATFLGTTTYTGQPPAGGPLTAGDVPVVPKDYLRRVRGVLPSDELTPCESRAQCIFRQFMESKTNAPSQLVGEAFRLPTQEVATQPLCMLCLLHSYHCRATLPLGDTVINAFRVQYGFVGEYYREDVLTSIPGIYGSLPVVTQCDWVVEGTCLRSTLPDFCQGAPQHATGECAQAASSSLSSTMPAQPRVRCS